MELIDFLSWKIIQGVCFLQFIICTILLRYAQGIKQKAELLGGAMAGAMIAHNKPEQVPPLIAKKLLLYGRLVIMMMLMSITIKILKIVLE